MYLGHFFQGTVQFSAADSAPPIQHRRLSAADQHRQFSTSQFSAGQFSAGQFRAGQFSAGQFSASLNDFDFKKFRPFFKENYVFCSSTIGQTWHKIFVLQKYSTTTGYWGFKPTYIGKNT
ncbi:Hypothetical protein FKW44_012199, partial [Caligus rogercresseyi]